MKVYLEFNLCDEQNPKISSESEEIKFSAKFDYDMNFFENRGKFELKNSIGDVMGLIRGVKNLNIYLKT